jgi:hypothetical protein
MDTTQLAALMQALHGIEKRRLSVSGFKRLFPQFPPNAVYLATESCSEELPFLARRKLLERGLTGPPECPQCQEKLKWVSSQNEWQSFCSVKCSTLYKYGVTHVLQRKDVQEKIQQTNLKRFGCENPFSDPAVKEKIKQFRQTHPQKKRCPLSAEKKQAAQEKRVNTSIQKYGVKHYSQTSEFKTRCKKTSKAKFGVEHPATQSAEVQAKIKCSLMAHYGVINPSQALSVKMKKLETTQRHYGVDNPSKSGVTQLRKEATSLSHWGVKHPSAAKVIQEKIRKTKISRSYPIEVLNCLTSETFWNAEYVKKEKTLDQIAQELNIASCVAGRFMHLYAPSIQIRPGSWISTQETEILEFLQANYPGPIQQQKTLGQIAHDTNQQMPDNPRYSLDLYLPELHLAIEHNGLYWHSTAIHPDPLYHLKKTQNAAQLGIRLIHIWEDDWRDKRSLMASKLRVILGVSQLPRIHARSCKISIPSASLKKEFYNAHHIKGDGQGSVTYSLVFNEETVAMLTLKRLNESSDSEWDLNRFAAHIGYRVPGAFSKLLHQFLVDYPMTNKIVTYADRCWSQGNVYLKNGFTLDSKNPMTPPAFHGVECSYTKRVSRRAYTHGRLKKRFPSTYDPNLTQLENLSRANIPVVYDCGNYKFVFCPVDQWLQEISSQAQESREAFIEVP